MGHPLLQFPTLLVILDFAVNNLKYDRHLRQLLNGWIEKYPILKNDSIVKWFLFVMQTFNLMAICGSAASGT